MHIIQHSEVSYFAHVYHQSMEEFVCSYCVRQLGVLNITEQLLKEHVATTYVSLSYMALLWCISFIKLVPRFSIIYIARCQLQLTLEIDIQAQVEQHLSNQTDHIAICYTGSHGQQYIAKKLASVHSYIHQKPYNYTCSYDLYTVDNVIEENSWNIQIYYVASQSV